MPITRTRIHANATSTWARKHAKQASTQALEQKKSPNTETRQARGLACSSNLIWQSRINGNFPKFLKNISETSCRIRNYIVLEHCLSKVCFSLKRDFSHSFFPRKFFLKILNHILPGKRLWSQQPTYTLKMNFIVIFQQRFLKNSNYSNIFMVVYIPLICLLIVKDWKKLIQAVIGLNHRLWATRWYIVLTANPVL